MELSFSRWENEATQIGLHFTFWIRQFCFFPIDGDAFGGIHAFEVAGVVSGRRIESPVDVVVFNSFHHVWVVRIADVHGNQVKYVIGVQDIAFDGNIVDPRDLYKAEVDGIGRIVIVDHVNAPVFFNGIEQAVFVVEFAQVFQRRSRQGNDVFPGRAFSVHRAHALYDEGIFFLVTGKTNQGNGD